MREWCLLGWGVSLLHGEHSVRSVICSVCLRITYLWSSQLIGEQAFISVTCKWCMTKQTWLQAGRRRKRTSRTHPISGLAQNNTVSQLFYGSPLRITHKHQQRAAPVIMGSQSPVEDVSQTTPSAAVAAAPSAPAFAPAPAPAPAPASPIPAVGPAPTSDVNAPDGHVPVEIDTVFHHTIHPETRLFG